MLRGNIDFDCIPVTPESGSNATCWVGYFVNSFEVFFVSFEGAIILQPIPFFLNSHVPRIVFMLAETQFA